MRAFVGDGKNSMELAQVTKTKSLGVSDDLNLCIDEHVKYIVNASVPKNCPTAWCLVKVIKFDDNLYFQFLLSAVNIQARLHINGKFSDWMQIVQFKQLS